ncbi:uncharacterized WD repeat-containing protein all2124-like [Liolophura sinensis]|uniref:uncharacterized WD repeat-containing protein all2124-like n=1 Tax=Liolophura sinensis TaxID=3198878 RepID=UPI003158FDD7
MSRRRLESAIQAGKAIDEGKSWPDKFEKVQEINQIKILDEKQGVFSLQFSYDGELLAIGYGNGAVELRNPLTGELVKELRKSRYGGYQVMCIRFNPKNPDLFFATTSEGMVYSCNIKDGSCQEIINEKGNEINCLDFSLDGFDFATAGKDLAVRLYDTKTLQMTKTYEGYNAKTVPDEVQSSANAMRVFALKYHPMNDDIFVTGGWENHLKIWDSRSNDGVKRVIFGPHICGDSLDLKGYEILTGSWVGHNALQLWGYTEGKLQKNVPFPSSATGEFLYCAQFCDNNVVLAGGSGTNSVQAVNTETGECLGGIGMEHPVIALDSTKGGRLFALAGTDRVIKIGAIC